MDHSRRIRALRNPMSRAELWVMLRTSLLVAALALAGQLISPGVDHAALGQELLRNAAAVSAMSTSVGRNEVNVLAQAIESERALLNAREYELSIREAAMDARIVEEVRRENRKTLLAILITALVLLTLVLANFYFDLHRGAPSRQEDGAEHRNGDPPSHGGPGGPHAGELVTKL